MAHILTSVSGSQADLIPVRRALLSVSDKTGLLDIARALADFGVQLLSTVSNFYVVTTMLVYDKFNFTMTTGIGRHR